MKLKNILNFQNQIKTILIKHIDHKNFISYSNKYFNKGKLLDIGCGNKRHKKYLVGKIDEYVGLDHEDTIHNLNGVDIIGTAYETNLRNDSFDYVLCNAVLEHLEEPQSAINECHRILKKDGICIYTVPLFWHLHEEPRDFFRYTNHGLTHLFKEQFEIIELYPGSGFWITASTMFCYYIDRFNFKIIRVTFIISIIQILIQILAFLLSKIKYKSIKGEEWTIMYTIVARKK